MIDLTLLVRSVTYPVNRTTTLTNYHRGIPQNIAYPGASESAVVNDRGEIKEPGTHRFCRVIFEYRRVWPDAL